MNTKKICPLKICMVSSDFIPNIGGIAAHVYELSKMLVTMGNDVTVITSRTNLFENSYEIVDNIKVCRLYLPKLKVIGFSLFIIQLWFKLHTSIKCDKFDVIHSHSLIPDALVASMINSVPKIETEHSSGFLYSVENGRNLRLYKYILNKSNYTIGPSIELVEAINSLGINRSKTLYISNGVDPDKFNLNTDGHIIRKKYGIGERDLLILCPRRLSPKNGVIYLIEAISKVKSNIPFLCLIVGDGLERDKLEKKVEEMQLSNKVRFAGNISNKEMPRYYAASDIVVLPSLKEATSISGLEAMSSGKPIIGTSVGGLPQIISHMETGILVSPRNADGLAYAINILLNDDELRSLMGEKARLNIENEFTWNKIAKDVLKVYKKALLISNNERT